MRKTVIALMLVLPMLFVLVIYGSLSVVSIRIPVSVSGIRILADNEVVKDGAFQIDFTDQQQHRITAEVEPATASEKGYVLTSDNPDVLTVGEDGVVKAVGEGTANVTATSKDKGFTDVIHVAVYAGLPFDVQFSLKDLEGNPVALSYNRSTQTYTAKQLETGKYVYGVEVKGGSSKEYKLAADEENSAFVENNESLFLPFGGEVALTLSVKDAFDVNTGMTNQTLERHIKLSMKNVLSESETGIAVNGVADGNTVLMAKESKKTTIYVECEGEPTVVSENAHGGCISHEQTRASGNHHVVEVTVNDGFEGNELEATIKADSKTANLTLSFADFDFRLNSDNLIKPKQGGFESVVLLDTPTRFYAVPLLDARDITYDWKVIGADQTVTPTVGEKSEVCSIDAKTEGTFTVSVQPMRGEEKIGAAKTIEIHCTKKVSYVLVTNSTKVDLAERYTVGGQKYLPSGSLGDNDSYEILNVGMMQGESSAFSNDWTRIKVKSSNPDIADVETREGRAYLVPKGTGAVTITAEWEYNEWFTSSNVVGKLALNVVKDAVEVNNYPDLVKAMDAKLKVVLTKNIMLGTNADGSQMSKAARQQIIDEHQYQSTYNTVFYETDDKHDISNTFVKYALEFTNDVYGNGFNLDAEYFTNEMDDSGKPELFTGPLVFVEYKGIAKVAGQDNIAYLIRTDGVKLYGVNLLGCSDDSLNDNEGNYELNHLNNVGTTLEINADCQIVNCRIRNGRNVVRVYGGNRDGNAYQDKHYFVTSIPSTNLSDEERILVNIEGCIITQGREFLVKVGTNKALQAGSSLGQEPVLRDANGVAYKENSFNGRSTSNNYVIADQDFFYNRYVMTDLTLKNSVLETSGLFCVGVESNFSGALLYSGASKLTGDGASYAQLTTTWRSSGATSFASMLRLAGDVRLYDWKDVSQVDSSTLIEATEGSQLSAMMKFDVSAMLQEVDGKPDYANLLYKENNKTFVHGGIAFYGGGRNYSQIDLSQLNEEFVDLTHLSINIGQFAGAENPVVARQAQLLPLAAGTHDFNFWLYPADSTNNYAKQVSDKNKNVGYAGVTKVPLFAD